MRFLIPLIIFFGLVGFLYAGLSLDPRKLDSTLIDLPAPSFELTTVLDVNKKLSQKDLLGQVSLLNVWASWCVSCRQEHPLFMQLAKQGGINIYGLNWKDTRADASNWLRQHGNPYKLSAFDPDGRTGIDYGVTGTPETFVIDKMGKVRHKHTGPVGVDDFRDVLWPLIKKLEAEQVKP